MSHFHQERVLSVRHWNDSLFIFTTTRSPSFRFRNGHFVMIGLEVEGLHLKDPLNPLHLKDLLNPLLLKDVLKLLLPAAVHPRAMVELAERIPRPTDGRPGT